MGNRIVNQPNIELQGLALLVQTKLAVRLDEHVGGMNVDSRH